MIKNLENVTRNIKENNERNKTSEKVNSVILLFCFQYSIFSVSHSFKTKQRLTRNHTMSQSVTLALHCCIEA